MSELGELGELVAERLIRAVTIYSGQLSQQVVKNDIFIQFVLPLLDRWNQNRQLRHVETASSYASQCVWWASEADFFK